MPIQPNTFPQTQAFLSRQFPGFDPAEFAGLLESLLSNYIPGPFEVAGLPSGSEFPNAITTVTDALSPVAGAEVVGGGTTHCVVFYDGAKWSPVTGQASPYASGPASMAELRTMTPEPGIWVNLLGYYSPGDGGEGEFYTVTGEAPGTFVDNGGTIIVPDGGDGSAAFLRNCTQGRAEVPWFGGLPIGDDMDCIDAVNRALSILTIGSAIRGDLVFPATRYAVENNTWYNVSEAIVIGDGAKQIDLTIDGSMPGAPQEFAASEIASVRTSSLTDDVIRVVPWVGRPAHLRMQNICVDGWDTTGSCIYLNGGQMTGPVLYNVQCIWGANGVRVGSNLVSPFFQNVTYHRNTQASLLVENEIDNGVFFQNIFQSGDMHAIKVKNPGFFIGSAFIYSVIEDYGDNSIIFEDCVVPPFQDVKFDGIWVEALAAGKSFIKIPASSRGLYFVKFKDVHFANNVVGPVDFIETISSATNVSQYLFFEQCDMENMGASNILTVDTDPSASSMGGYQHVEMNNTWFPGMTNPVGCYPPALTGSDPVQFIGFIPAVNTNFGQQPEYIYNSEFYTVASFKKGVIMENLPTVDPADGNDRIWCDTAAGRVLKLGT